MSAHVILAALLQHIHNGRFQISLSLVAALSGLLSGLEVSFEHYRGSYGQKVMFTPVLFSALLSLSGIAGALSAGLARTVLPAAAVLLIADGLIGFGFHIRGIARKPGGWRRNLITNIVMGPPLFAPLLLCTGGMVGIIASMLVPEDAVAGLAPDRIETVRLWFAVTAALSTLLNGFEVLYSHYQARFANSLQWIPIVLTPPLLFAAALDIFFPHLAVWPLAVMSVLAMLAGVIGTFMHLRGVFRRPGASTRIFYSLVYGPPAFAPLLFAASGLLGLLAVIMGENG